MIQEQSDEEGEKHRQETCYLKATILNIENKIPGNISISVAAGFTRYFLGGRRPDNGNITEFYWEPSGVPISYSRWRPGQPYPADDDSNCIMIKMDHDWLWDDNSCRTPSIYMCQIVYDG
ncbi:hypothetical protein LSH36_472g02062 [Paralvinella palmiformis]|uniref:C-type lectin domain-containing protein n=1 Tax=Paralvinella palmiformis TaxID=53620 RepID=A0AAD9MYL5_9ANNE|nr:hypothetical protein LSH36_472g02062 [Paralvinella palmiformis]